MLLTRFPPISGRIVRVALILFISYLCAIAISTSSITLIFMLGVLSFGLLFMIKPFCGILAAMFLDLWFNCIRISMISLRTYLIIFLLGIVIINLFFTKTKPLIHRHVKTILFISTLLFLWIIFKNMTAVEFQSQRLLGTISQTLNPVLIGFLTLLMIKNIRELKIFIYLMALGASVSAFFGIMQFFNIGIFWQIRAQLGPVIDYQRVPGLAFFGGYLSYQLGSIIPLMLGVFLTTGTYIKGKEKNFILTLISIMCLGLLLTLVRSGIFGCLVGTLTTLLLSKRYRFSRLLVFFLIAIFAIYPLGRVSERMFKLGGSALGRIPLAITAIKIAHDNPLGVGRGQWAEQAEQYVSEIRHLPYYQIVLATSSHNQFLNVLVYWGIPGLALLIMFYRQIFKGLNFVRKTTDNPFFQSISIGLLGCFISYIINSMFHNMGPFVGDPFNWYLIGISMVLMNLEHKSKGGVFNAKS